MQAKNIHNIQLVIEETLHRRVIPTSDHLLLDGELDEVVVLHNILQRPPGCTGDVHSGVGITTMIHSSYYMHNMIDVIAIHAVHRITRELFRMGLWGSNTKKKELRKCS